VVEHVTLAPRVQSVRPLHARITEVSFEDGVVREVNLLDRPRRPAGAEILDSDSVSRSVGVGPVSRTVCWPTGVDLDPDVLYGLREPAWSLRRAM
jgi:uncharacterized protein DUF2442